MRIFDAMRLLCFVKKEKKINKKYEKNSEEFQYGDFIKSDENS